MALRLQDILDLPVMQAMLDSLWRANGISLALLDADGEILVASGRQKLCTEYHFRHPEIKPRCILNHLVGPPVTASGSEPSPREYTCSSGLIDVTLPIHIEGNYLGTLFAGQFLDHPPDRERARRYAVNAGFEPEHYLALLAEVPVIPRDKINHCLAFFAALIRLLTDTGLRKLREAQIRQSLEASEQALRESEERFRSIVQATPLGIHMYQCDADGRLIFVGYNPAADAILGVDNRQFLGKELLEAFPALAGTEVPEGYRQVCDRGEPWEVEQINYVDGRISGAFEVHAFRTGPNRMASVFMDIGERLKALDTIRASEATLGGILAAAPLSIGLGHERVFNWVNRWMLEELGYAEQELVGRSARLLYESDAEFERVGLVRLATVDRGIMGETETRWRRRDGTLIDVLLRFTRIDPAQPAKGVIFAALNITEAKRAATALVEREERIRLLLNSAGEGIFGVDVEGRCTFANQTCLALLGFDDEAQMLGRRTHGLMHHTLEDGTPYHERDCHIYNAFRSGKSVHHTGELFWRADGSSFHAEYRAHPIIREGVVIGTVVNFTDITERQLAERRLLIAHDEMQRARSQADAILRSVADALVVIDPQGCILTVNPAAVELLGGDADRIIGAPLAARLADPEFLEQIGQVAAGNEASTIFDMAPCRDAAGRERILQARVARIEGGEEGRCSIVAILRDVTREREIERLKDEFISTAAHELRTPITAILGYAEIMLDQYRDFTEEQMREFLGVIYGRSEALAQIVEEMLDLSRMQSGQVIHLVMQPAELGALAREVVNQYQVATDGHRFRLQVAEALPMLVFDTAKLRQVFDNLLSNACKFSPPGSEVAITVADQDGEVLVSVSDEGVGMTPEQIERIFDKFYRADASNTAVSGLGLGMSLVKGIIEGHGGRIWVTSAPGLGTTVVFVLPKPGQDKG